MKKFIVILAIGLCEFAIISQNPGNFSFSHIKSLIPFVNKELSTSDKALKHAFENSISDLQIGGYGKVIKIFPDDNEGSRHQRFIIKLK